MAPPVIPIGSSTGDPRGLMSSRWPSRLFDRGRRGWGAQPACPRDFTQRFSMRGYPAVGVLHPCWRHLQRSRTGQGAGSAGHLPRALATLSRMARRGVTRRDLPQLNYKSPPVSQKEAPIGTSLPQVSLLPGHRCCPGGMLWIGLASGQTEPAGPAQRGRRIQWGNATLACGHASAAGPGRRLRRRPPRCPEPGGAGLPGSGLCSQLPGQHRRRDRPDHLCRHRPLPGRPAAPARRALL